MTANGTANGTGPAREAAVRALEDLLDAYGADPARWPAGDPRRAAAWALIDSGDAAALQSLATARALDRALDSTVPPAPSAALAGAVLRAARRTRPGLAGWAGWAGSIWTPAFFKPAGALACAMLLGVMVGMWSPVPVVGIGESRAAGLETELAALAALEENGDAGRFGGFAE
ncbi:MAG: hypothetical protein OXH59_19775 [Rhodospirillaceae bacterium]|nr:hypothetical protein [Rhodospirillaceae bacterium]